MNIQRYHDLCTSLFNAAERNRSVWERVVNKVMPEVVEASYLRDQDEDASSRKRLCTRARVDIRKLASAAMSYIFPMGHRWFRYTHWRRPNDKNQRLRDKQWFNIISQDSRAELERSNFYSAILKALLDWASAGTGLILTEMDDDKSLLVHTHVPVGTFGLAADSYNNLNAVARKFLMTPAQLHEQFGYANLTPKMQQDFDDVRSRFTKTHEVWHLVTPRYEHQGVHQGDVVPEQRPWASVFMPANEHHILWEGGYFEMPYTVIRFTSFGSQVFGATPLLDVEDTIDDLMVAEDVAKIIGQRSAIPSVVVPADMADEVDLTAGGRTLVPQPYINAAVPREFAPPSNYQLALDNIARLQEEIDDATFVNVLQIFSNADRYMTATEVTSREAEKIMTFSSAFMQMQSDFRIFANRLFALMVRKGYIDLNDAPEDVLVRPMGDNENLYIMPPKLAFIGRLSQAMERVQTNGLQAFLGQHLQLMAATQDPRYLSCIDPQALARGEAEKMGVDCDYLLDVDYENAQLRQLEERQQQAQQAALAQQQAAVEKDRAQAMNAAMQYQR